MTEVCIGYVHRSSRHPEVRVMAPVCGWVGGVSLVGLSQHCIKLTLSSPAKSRAVTYNVVTNLRLHGEPCRDQYWTESHRDLGVE